MFTIYGGKTEFEQWDLDQLITCDCLKEGDEVVFSGHGKTYETTAFTQDGEVWADVPNFLLKEPGSFRVDLGWGLNCHMDCRTTFTVKAKEKPANYKCGVNIKGRGGTSWNDLKDKPFGDLPTGGDTLTWDGNTEGLVAFDAYYKVSDATPTMDDFINGCTLVLSEGSTYDVPADEFADIGEVTGDEQMAGALIVVGFILIYPRDIDLGDGILAKKGTYFCNSVDGTTIRTTSLTIPGYTGFPVTKKIEDKYLPGATVLYTDGTYLYNTEDTTDESNRTTKAELMNAWLSGVPFRVGQTKWNVTGYYSPGLAVAVGDYAYTMLSGGDEFVSFYTAEYTGE